ncbi:hypothetical protein RND71_021496 [Anisodus tanguticus]|uniref:Uncharacterized protein n=1 Tax=Anisodus tanguticus TaxID=243964 RepID=A0AAE1RY85_9SOLA|nr:hypothetical protein RND71_021496 [Anisodus tanguticus]
MSIVEMQMLRCIYIRLNKVKIDYSHQQVQVAHIENKIRESCLRWFDHISRQLSDASP